ncbi:MAG: phenylalanine--tRNA ligase subunit alpha [Crenarchaeota archaeon]|nr:phenylalanine--tRNA ligase subunit alpha [Thermoproteota archaeon]
MPEEYVNILRIVFEKGCVSVDDVASTVGRDVNSLMRILGELEFRGLIRTLRNTVKLVELSDEGLNYAEVGLPELRLLSYVRDKHGPDLREISLDELLQCCREMFSEKMCSIILSNLVRSGLCRVEDRRVKFSDTISRVLEKVLRKQKFLEELKNVGTIEASHVPLEILQEFQKRRLVRVRERTRIVIELTDLGRKLISEGKIVPARVITALTSDILRSREWDKIILKEFDLSIQVPELRVAVPHFMREFLELIRDIFVELGFEEVHGPICEVEFWNFDALFQAQDHPAREVHDTFFIKHPTRGPELPRELMERVGKVHEDGWETGSRGWRYRWSPERALRLILRTQTTAVTIRALYERGEGEYRVFTIGKVFRPETLDPKHAMEFYQADGIVVGKDVKFKHLLSILEVFVKKLGIEKVMFKPAYFPFTCPSAEGYIWHEKLGWVEFVGCGMFRPEVTYPAGVRNCKVLAFGMGLDRLAMTLLEIDDIRHIHARDAEKLKECYSKLVKRLKIVRS